MRSFVLMYVLAVSLPAAKSAYAQSSVIEGVAYDSLRNHPLAHASVVASPASNVRDTTFHSALTDERGHFRLQGLMPGHYTVSVEHEFTDSIGVGIPDVGVDVPATGTTRMNVATPSPRTLRQALCPATANDSTVGVMLGVVRLSSGEPVRSASVVFTWSDFDVDKRTAIVTNKQLTTTSVTDAQGVYRQCALPIARSVFVQAQGDAQSHSGILEETVGTAGIQVRDLRLAANADSSSVARGVVLSGTVTDVSDRPIATAQINLPGSSRTTTTNERGEFRLTNVSPGTYGVEVLAIGYSPRTLRVDVDRSTSVLNIKMERIAVILDSLQVIATRTYRDPNIQHREFDQRARSTGWGSFMTRARLDSIQPMTILDALRRMSGVRLILPRGSYDYVAISTRGAINFESEVCPLQVFLNGMKLSQDVLSSIPPQALYGIEVQPVSSASVRYNVGACGAIFLWTR